MTDITPIILGVIAIIIAIATYFVIPFIKSKLTATQWENLQTWASAAVQAAEAIFIGTKLGKDKRDYVLKQLTNLCNQNGYKFDEDKLRIALENAWLSMKQGE